MAKCVALFKSLKEYPEDFERAREAYYSWESLKGLKNELNFKSNDDEAEITLDMVMQRAVSKATTYVKEHSLELLKMEISSGKRSKPVLKVDIKNLEIEMFPSVQEAAKDTGILSNHFSKFISQKKLMHNAYYFRASDL